MVLQNARVTAEDLAQIDHDLGEDDLEIEGEIQALEELNRLDVDDAKGDKNDRKRREVRGEGERGRGER
jgi:hypothetical protein